MPGISRTEMTLNVAPFIVPTTSTFLPDMRRRSAVRPLSRYVEVAPEVPTGASSAGVGLLSETAAVVSTARRVSINTYLPPGFAGAFLDILDARSSWTHPTSVTGEASNRGLLIRIAATDAP